MFLKKIGLLYFLVLMLMNSFVYAWVSIDFDVAMQTDKYPKEIRITRQVTGYSGDDFLTLCRSLYNRNNPGVKEAEMSTVKIPKVIHQIWIGGPVPVAFEAYRKTWVAENLGPDWEYKLWQEKDIDKLNLYNRAFYDQIENPAAKADLARCQIVYNEGGYYVDMDFELLNPEEFKKLSYMYDFCTALQPLDTLFVQLGIAFFGACPGHPILKHCIETVKDDWHLHGVPARTGPIHFSKSFFAMAGRDGLVDIAFPAFHFYPLGCRQTVLRRSEWIEYGAYAVHHWSKSWMPAFYRPGEFKKLDNDAAVASWND